MVAAKMHLRLVALPLAEPNEPVATPRHSMVAPRGATLSDYPFEETCLVVAFAASDDLSNARAGGRLPLAAMPEISGEDAYLVLPLRAREGLVTAFARGHEGRVAHWFDEAVVVRAELDGGRAPKLWVGAAWPVREVLEGRDGERVSLGSLGDAVRVINQLDHVEGISPGGLFDRRGVEAVTSRSSYVGVSRMGVEALGLGADAVEPTYVWSVRDGDLTRVRVALCASDDDSITALLTPVTLCP